MLNTDFTRTTITLPVELLYLLKKKALNDKKSLTEVVNEGLNRYAGLTITPTSPKKLMDLYGSWGKGTSGKTFLKKTRYAKKDAERDKYILKLWNKS